MSYRKTERHDTLSETQDGAQKSVLPVTVVKEYFKNDVEHQELKEKPVESGEIALVV